MPVSERANIDSDAADFDSTTDDDPVLFPEATSTTSPEITHQALPFNSISLHDQQLSSYRRTTRSNLVTGHDAMSSRRVSSRNLTATSSKRRTTTYSTHSSSVASLPIDDQPRTESQALSQQSPQFSNISSTVSNNPSVQPSLQSPTNNIENQGSRANISSRTARASLVYNHHYDSDLDSQSYNISSQIGPLARTNTASSTSRREYPKRPCSTCGKLCSIKKNGTLFRHNCLTFSGSVSMMQSTPVDSSVENTSQQHHSLPSTQRQSINQDIASHYSPTSINQTNLPNSNMRSYDSGHADSPDARHTQPQSLSPIVEFPDRPRHPPPVIHVRRNGSRVTQRQKWIAEHVELMINATLSTTRGEFDTRLLALLKHSPPGVPVLDRIPTLPSLNTVPNDPFDNERSLLSIDQAHLPDRAKAIPSMMRYLLNGNLQKARQAAHGTPVARIGSVHAQEQLKTKYPIPLTHPVPPDPQELLDAKQQPIDRTTIYIENSDSMATYIMQQKRGASKGLNGISNDDYQDILKHDPNSIHHLLTICNLIAAGTLTDGPERMHFIEGKGTALIKPDGGIRPIVTEDPLLKIVGHAMAVEHRDTIRTVCGDEQFMGVSAGCEIVAHFVRYLLEADHSLVVGKVDCRNAFNEISKTTILEVVADEAQMLLPYANFLLNATPTRTIFHDHHADVTVAHDMHAGVPQGGSMSSAFFNMGQSRSIRIARERHPNVFICLIADDTHVIGSPADVIAAIVTIREEYATAGLTLAATTADKNVLFGLGNNYSQQDKNLATANNLHWIPSTLGLLVGGAPVGSKEYMIEKVNITVDTIIAEMKQLEDYITGPHGTAKARVQTIYTMIRMCVAQQLTYLLRTCPPSTTAHAAHRLDVAIANTVLRITDCVRSLPREGTPQMDFVLNQLFMTVRLGGMGQTCSTDIRYAAYVASLLQCTARIALQLSTAGIQVATNLPTPGMIEFQDAVISLQARGVTCLDRITVQSLWSDPAQYKMQGKISAQIQQLRRQKEFQSLPTGPPGHGNAVYRRLSPNEAAIRRQGLVNLTCPDSGQWICANPAFHENKMNDRAFCISIQVRMKLQQNGSRTACICGDPLDCLCDHVLVCRNRTVRNKARNTAHASLSLHMRHQAATHQTTGNYYLATGEPLVENYLQRRNVDNNQLINATGLAARRADIALISTTHDQPHATLIDVTFAAHNAQSLNADFVAGNAALARANTKRANYERDFITDNNDVKLVVFAVETSGAIHSEARNFLKDRITASARHNPTLAFQRSLQSLSVCIQTCRAQCITIARDLLSLDEPPTFPYIVGDIPPVPPIREPITNNPARYNALTVPPRRQPRYNQVGQTHQASYNLLRSNYSSQRISNDLDNNDNSNNSIVQDSLHSTDNDCNSDDGNNITVRTNSSAHSIDRQGTNHRDFLQHIAPRVELNTDPANSNLLGGSNCESDNDPNRIGLSSSHTHGNYVNQTHIHTSNDGPSVTEDRLNLVPNDSNHIVHTHAATTNTTSSNTNHNTNNNNNN